MSAFQVPSMPAAATAGAAAFSLVASFPPTVVCLQPASASNETAAIAAVIVFRIDPPLLRYARHDWRVRGLAASPLGPRQRRQTYQLITRRFVEQPEIILKFNNKDARARMTCAGR